MSDPSVPELLDEALALDGEARRAWLTALAAERPDVAAEVESLLARAEGASPLDRTPWRHLVGPHATIGAYRVEEEIGRGGMGRVYRAVEETPDFRRVVALKIIDRPEFDERAIERFREEVRVLSGLEHPGIARFLFGGRSAEGIWHLALEYVEGEGLIDFAASRSLDVKARVALLLQAVEAVAHAHSRGVVHRDLKPAHLLVDGDGRVRLLDFGIARLVDDGSSIVATATIGGAALTPAYASPEQFRGEAVGKPSDVFSLGVVLYELLSGSRPFGRDSSSVMDLAREVVETDPRPPSTASRTREPEEARGTVDPLSPLRIDRDLDAICLKALRKQPGARYADASAFAADLRAFLEHRPVEARQGGARYRAGRFAARHRAALAIGTGVAIAVFAVGFALRSQHRLRTTAPPDPSPRPYPYSTLGSVPLETLEAEFRLDPSNAEAGAAYVLALVRASRLDEATLILGRVRQIEGADREPLVDFADGSLGIALGEPQRALVALTGGRDRAAEQGRGDLVAQIRATRGRLLATLGDREEAVREMSLARDAFAAIDDPASLSRVLNDLAIERLRAGGYAEGEALLREAVDAAKRAGNTPGTMITNLALLEHLRGRPDLAEVRLEALLVLRRSGTNRRQLGQTLYNLGVVTHDLGKSRSSRDFFDESLTVLRGIESNSTLHEAVFHRAEAALDLGGIGEATNAAKELEQFASTTGDFLPLARSRYLRGRLAALADDPVASDREFGAARDLYVENGDLDQALEMDVQQAVSALRSARIDVAESAAERALEASGEGDAAKPQRMFVETVLVRVEVARDRRSTAVQRIRQIDFADRESTSLARQLQRLLAQASLAIAENREDEARRAIAAGSRRTAETGRIVEAMDFAMLEILAEAAFGSTVEAHRLAEVLKSRAGAAQVPAVRRRAGEFLAVAASR